MVREVFERRVGQRAGTQPLENLLQRIVKDGFRPRRVAAYANTVRELGNLGAHSFGERVSQSDVLSSLTQLTVILDWYFLEEWPLREPAGVLLDPSVGSEPDHSPLTQASPGEAPSRGSPSDSTKTPHRENTSTSDSAEEMVVPARGEPAPKPSTEIVGSGRPSLVGQTQANSAQRTAVTSAEFLRKRPQQGTPPGGAPGSSKTQPVPVTTQLRPSRIWDGKAKAVAILCACAILASLVIATFSEFRAHPSLVFAFTFLATIFSVPLGIVVRLLGGWLHDMVKPERKQL